MNFGDAITALKAGDWVRRRSFPSTRMWIFMEGPQDLFLRGPGPTDKQQWTATTDDILATDWKLSSQAEVEDRERAEDEAAAGVREEDKRRQAAIASEREVQKIGAEDVGEMPAGIIEEPAPTGRRRK